MQLKICGMKYNTQEVAALQPDYLGFIFYEGSPRNYGNQPLPTLSATIKKVGVFVDAALSFVQETIVKHHLDVVQLHGTESPQYIQDLTQWHAKQLASPNSHIKKKEFGIWKVFGIKDDFDFEKLKPYEGLVTAFLFDTQGKNKGGNGYAFDWTVLQDYSSATAVVLSGGIGMESLEALKEIQHSQLPLLAIDVNSKFEDRPGEKNIELLETFKKNLRL